MQRFFLFDLKKDKKTFLKILILKGKQIVQHTDIVQCQMISSDSL